MGKRIGTYGPQFVPEPSRTAPSAQISKSLEASKRHTIDFMRHRGFSLLGAGRTHSYAKKPTRDARTVTGVAQQHLLPTKRPDKPL